jgi:hypothetical protein
LELSQELLSQLFGLLPRMIPLVISAVAQVTSAWVAGVSILNAMLACGDILGTGIALFQIPGSAIVRNQGWKTYWREHEAAAA